MKIVLISLLSILASFSGFGQNGKNINIPGTKISMIPPTGFKLSDEYSGFQKGDAMITVMDLAGGNYYSNTATFTREAFEDKGVKVFDYQDIQLNGYAAKFIHIEGNAGTKSYNLVFGDSTFAVMAVAVYPAKDTNVEVVLKEALFSSTYNKNLTIDPFATASFTIDDSKSAFKYSQANSNMFVYTIGGQMQNKNGEPILLILPLPAVEGNTPEGTCEQMMVGLQSQGLTDIVMVSKSPLQTNNGSEAYEILISGSMEGNSTFILIQSMIKGKKQLVIQGVMNGSIAGIEEMRNLSQTIKFK